MRFIRAAESTNRVRVLAEFIYLSRVCRRALIDQLSDIVEYFDSFAKGINVTGVPFSCDISISRCSHTD